MFLKKPMVLGRTFGTFELWSASYVQTCSPIRYSPTILIVLPVYILVAVFSYFLFRSKSTSARHCCTGFLESLTRNVSLAFNASAMFHLQLIALNPQGSRCSKSFLLILSKMLVNIRILRSLNIRFQK